MTAILLVFLLVLILLNGLFVAAEIGLVRSRRSRLEVMANEGDKGAGQALAQLSRIDEYIAACQVGITLCSIGIGFLGEPSLKHLLEPVFGGFADAAAAGIAVVIAFVIVTSLHITIGELVPKLMAISHAEGAARRLARPLEAFRAISAPFAVLLTAIAKRIVRVFGVDTESMTESATSEDLKVLIAQSQTGGVLDAGEATMLSGVFHFHEQQAREVMTPIPAVVTLDASENVETALRRCISSGHTRLVVIEDDNPDRVRGIVHINSLTRLYMDVGPEASIEPAIRDAPVFPETKPLDDLLAELQRQRSSMEVVGEIEDETDAQADSLRRLPDGDWYARGHVSLGDLADAGIELPVDTDAFNSIGGYVFSELGRLPKRGDTVLADGYTIRVESVRENRIVAVRIGPPAT
jgi:CBS domain containing-hemolysin-like protein